MLGWCGAVFSEARKIQPLHHQSLKHSYIAVAEFIRHLILRLFFNHVCIYGRHINLK
jgi:hypothetical protein